MIAYPTETVYGLGCDPLNAEAVIAILRLKQRKMGKGLIVVGADTAHLAPYIAPDQHHLLTLLEQTPEVPTTWLLPTHPAVPHWITGGRPRIALRLTRHPIAAQLCRTLGGGLISTSANPAGRPPACTALQVRRYFGNALDYIVTGNGGLTGKPSEIRDAVSGAVLRPITH